MKTVTRCLALLAALAVSGSCALDQQFSGNIGAATAQGKISAVEQDNLQVVGEVDLDVKKYGVSINTQFDTQKCNNQKMRFEVGGDITFGPELAQKANAFCGFQICSATSGLAKTACEGALGTKTFGSFLATPGLPKSVASMCKQLTSGKLTAPNQIGLFDLGSTITSWQLKLSDAIKSAQPEIAEAMTNLGVDVVYHIKNFEIQLEAVQSDLWQDTYILDSTKAQLCSDWSTFMGFTIFPGYKVSDLLGMSGVPKEIQAFTKCPIEVVVQEVLGSTTATSLFTQDINLISTINQLLTTAKEPIPAFLGNKLNSQPVITVGKASQTCDPTARKFTVNVPGLSVSDFSNTAAVQKALATFATTNIAKGLDAQLAQSIFTNIKAAASAGVDEATSSVNLETDIASGIGLFSGGATMQMLDQVKAGKFQLTVGGKASGTASSTGATADEGSCGKVPTGPGCGPQVAPKPSGGGGSGSGGDDHHHGHGGEIAGIVIGGIILVGIIIYAVFHFQKNKKENNGNGRAAAEYASLDGPLIRDA